MLTDSRLDAIRARIERATPGSYRVERHDKGVTMHAAFAVTTTRCIVSQYCSLYDAELFAACKDDLRDVLDENAELRRLLIGRRQPPSGPATPRTPVDRARSRMGGSPRRGCL